MSVKLSDLASSTRGLTRVETKLIHKVDYPSLPRDMMADDLIRVIKEIKTSISLDDCGTYATEIEKVTNAVITAWNDKGGNINE